MEIRTNLRVRIEMLKYNVSNVTLGKVLGLRRESVSAMLRFELADTEQDKLIEAVHKAANIGQ